MCRRQHSSGALTFLERMCFILVDLRVCGTVQYGIHVCFCGVCIVYAEACACARMRMCRSEVISCLPTSLSTLPFETVSQWTYISLYQLTNEL